MAEIEYPTTVEGWQEFFNREFPDGLLTTQVRSTESAAFADDSPQALISEIRVISVEDEMPTLSLRFADFPRDAVIDVERVEERNYGYFVVTAETNVPDYVFSKNISDSQRQAVRREREEGLL